MFRWRDDEEFEEFSVHVDPTLAACRGHVDPCNQTRLGPQVWGSEAMDQDRIVIVPAGCTAAAIHNVTTKCSSIVQLDDGPIELTDDEGFVAAGHGEGITVLATPRAVFELVE